MQITTLRNFAPLPLSLQQHPADIEVVKKSLREHSTAELADQLSRFGDLMINEVLFRSGAIEAKAQSALGWALAILAFLLIGSDIKENPGLLRAIPLTLCALSALWSTWWSYDALRLRKWTWPSQVDWFQHDLFGDIDRLRRYHLLSLLENHQWHNTENAKKAKALERAQYGLFAAAILLAFVTIWSLLL
jgi:hypothetical protein